MIIVIGKEDKNNIKDAIAYINQCVDYFSRDSKMKVFVADCKRIISRLYKAIGEENNW